MLDRYRKRSAGAALVTYRNRKSQMSQLQGTVESGYNNEDGRRFAIAIYRISL